MDFDTIADEIYRLTPAEFTAARDQRAAEARRAGDRALSEAVKKLRRPTMGAWLANLLAHQQPGKVAQLLDLGEHLRRAQEDLSAADLRRLSAQRRQVVSALSDEGARLATELGQAVSDAAVRELETTLETALADEAAGEAVRSGRLTTALQYSGFGPVDLSGAVAGPVARPPAAPEAGRRAGAGGPVPPAKSAAERRQQERREVAEQQLGQAEAAVQGARHQLTREEAILSGAHRRHEQLQAEVAQRGQQLKELQERESEAAREVRQLQRAHDAAAAVLNRAEATLERAKDEATGFHPVLASAGPTQPASARQLHAHETEL